jgi:hypothetical protein
MNLSSSTIQTTRYGLDINAPITGVFHIEGHLLIEHFSYHIRVQIKPMVDEFPLHDKIGLAIGL